MKRYFIYWDTNKGISGNSILEFNPERIVMVDLIDTLLGMINEKLNEEMKVSVENVTIKFMMELK